MMARPYSMDLRERAVRSVEVDGLSRRAAAARFGLGVSTVINWVRWCARRVTCGRAGWAVTNRGRSPAIIANGCWGAAGSGTSPCAAWSPSSASAVSGSTIARYGSLFTPSS